MKILPIATYQPRKTIFKSNNDLGTYLSNINVSDAVENDALKSIQNALKTEQVLSLRKKRNQNEIKVEKNIYTATGTNFSYENSEIVDLVQECFEYNDRLLNSSNLLKVDEVETIKTKDPTPEIKNLTAWNNIFLNKENYAPLKIEPFSFEFKGAEILSDVETAKYLEKFLYEFHQNDSIAINKRLTEIAEEAGKYFAECKKNLKTVRDVKTGAKRFFEFVPVLGLHVKLTRVETQQSMILTMFYDYKNNFFEKTFRQDLGFSIIRYLEKLQQFRKYCDLNKPLLSAKGVENVDTLISKLDKTAISILTNYRKILSSITLPAEQFVNEYKNIISNGEKQLFGKALRTIIFLG